MSISGIIAFTVLVIFVNCMVLLLGKESFHDCFNIDVTSGLLFSEDDAGAINERQVLINRELLSKCDTEKSNVLAEKKSLPTDTPSCVLKCKSVFKCKICPRIICLSEETLRDHLQSKVMCLFFWWLIMLKQQLLLFIVIL